MEKKESHINISLYYKKNQSYYYYNNETKPILLSNSNVLEIIFKKKDILKIYTLFCFNKDKIYKILYNDEEIKNMIQDEEKKSLGYNFYLNLLINPEVFDYSFSFEYINNNNKENKYKIILLSKYILCLIINYKGKEDFYDDKKQEFLENKEVLIRIGLDLDEKKIELIKLDELYIKIIKQLIINRKFDDYSYNLLNHIEINNIYLTKKMCDELFKILTEKEEYISDYLILNQEDLFNEKKINFYYLFFKLLKNPLYIYQFPFILKTKRSILEQLKLKLNKLISRKKNKYYNDKLKYIKKIILDLEFYFINYQKNIKAKLKEVKTYYEEFYFKSKKEDIDNIEEIIKNNNYIYDNNDNDFEKYLKDYDLAKKMNF